MASASVTPERVREQLDTVVDPCSAAHGTNLSILDMGLLKSLTIDGTAVTVELRLTTPGCMMISYFVDEIEAAVGDLSGVSTVTVETDSGLEWRPKMMTEQAHERRQEKLRELEREFGSDDPIPDLPTLATDAD